MHLLIPFAAPLSEAGRAALKRLELPALASLLRRLDAAARDDGDATSLSPPHERALAREYGWHGADGTLPWAAHEAERAGIDPAGRAWALLTPVHWHVGSDAISVVDPDTLALDEAQSRGLFDALQPAFDGAFVWRSPLLWLAAHRSFEGLPAASLDRVVGRGIAPWLADARQLVELQLELQMRLHDHPVNDSREARGLLPINSVWISGCGVHQRAQQPADLVVDDRLRGPALAEDWDAWAAAWRALDAGPVAALPADAVLTLCGERSALRLEPRRGWWPRRAAAAAPRTLLESL